MPSIEFYYIPASGVSRAVEMTAAVVGVTLNKHLVDLMAGEQNKDEYAKLNPRRKVPFIVDGQVKIGESRAIMIYLAEKYMKSRGHFYPVDVDQRARINEILFFDMALLDSVYKLLKPRLTGHDAPPDPEAEAELRRPLTYLEDRLKANGGKKFLFGNEFTLADISLAASLSLLEAADYDLNEFKHSVAYFRELKESIPKYHEINDEGVVSLRKFMQRGKK